jgi:hypothetical protein
MLQELSNTRDAIRYAVNLNNVQFLEGATHEDEWKRHHLLLARDLSDDEWDAVALGYGEGTIAFTLLETYEEGEWQAEAERIADLADEGCKVLRTRSHRKPADQSRSASFMSSPAPPQFAPAASSSDDGKRFA